MESVYSLSFRSHSGTRVDSPKHFSLMAKVWKRFDLRPLLVDLQFWKWDGTGTTVSDLDGNASDVLVGDIILLYTGSSNPVLQDNNARRNFSCPEESAADWIVNHKVKHVGIDSLSINNYGFVEDVAHKSCWLAAYIL